MLNFLVQNQDHMKGKERSTLVDLINGINCAIQLQAKLPNMKTNWPCSDTEGGLPDKFQTKLLMSGQICQSRLAGVHCTCTCTMTV